MPNFTRKWSALRTNAFGQPCCRSEGNSHNVCVQILDKSTSTCSTDLRCDRALWVTIDSATPAIDQHFLASRPVCQRWNWKHFHWVGANCVVCRVEKQEVSFQVSVLQFHLICARPSWWLVLRPAQNGSEWQLRAELERQMVSVTGCLRMWRVWIATLQFRGQKSQSFCPNPSHTCVSISFLLLHRDDLSLNLRKS